MKFARLFVDRPIAGIVLSLMILLAGLASMGRLPLTEYPNVMPTTVRLYPKSPVCNGRAVAAERTEQASKFITNADQTIWVFGQQLGCLFRRRVRYQKSLLSLRGSGRRPAVGQGRGFCWNSVLPPGKPK